MKVLAPMMAMGFVILLVCPAVAEDTPSQPLTRADCDKAGMSWDDAANVCAGKAAAPKVEMAPKVEAAPKAEGASKPVGAQGAKPGKKKSTYYKAPHKHAQQTKPVEYHPFKWLFRNQSKAGKS